MYESLDFFFLLEFWGFLPYIEDTIKRIPSEKLSSQKSDSQRNRNSSLFHRLLTAALSCMHHEIIRTLLIWNKCHRWLTFKINYISSHKASLWYPSCFITFNRLEKKFLFLIHEFISKYLIQIPVITSEKKNFWQFTEDINFT